MALTTNEIDHDVEGSKIRKVIELTFTGVTGGKVVTGLQNVVSAVYQPTKTDDHGYVKRNSSDASGTFEAGSVYVDGVTSGDTGDLIVSGY